MLKLDSKPEPIEVELTKCAVVVVGMQNAFAREGRDAGRRGGGHF